jgi:hypothetical protein
MKLSELLWGNFLQYVVYQGTRALRPPSDIGRRSNVQQVNLKAAAIVIGTTMRTQ